MCVPRALDHGTGVPWNSPWESSEDTSKYLGECSFVPGDLSHILSQGFLFLFFFFNNV